MSDKKAKMFNKRAAHPKYKADEIMQMLSVQPGQTIADIGSGGGYFTFRFAQIVGASGRVYAVDTNQEFLDFIQQQATKQGVSNVITLRTSSEHPDLPKRTFDIIFLRNVTHHLSNRIAYFKRLKEVLKANGTLVIIEFDGRGGFFSFQRLHRHFIPQHVLIEETQQAGFVLLNHYDSLSEQSFMMFSVR
jgi:arsenite methyltransferase